MAIQDINIGTNPNDGTGDSLRAGAQKINSNNADFQQQIDTKGDMLKSVYDTGDNGIVDKAQNIIFKAELNQSVVKGNLLYAVGRNLVTGDPIVGLAFNTVNFADKTVGMALENGNASDVIEVVKIGVIENIDTSGFSLGETVYLSTSGTFDKKSNITAGVFNPVGYVVKSGFLDGVIIIDTTATESINTDNTINQSNVVGRTVTDALNNLIPEYRSAQAGLTRVNQTTIPLANQQNNVFEEYFSDNFTPQKTSNYTISIAYRWSSNNVQNNAIFRFTLSDGTTDIVETVRVEPKDSGGAGEVVNVLQGGAIVGNVNTGTDQRIPEYYPLDVELTAGVTYSLKIEWTKDTGTAALTIYSSTIRWQQNTITQ